MSISSIMTGLEGLTPTFDSDVVVNVWAYDAMKDTLNESECPVRMIGRNDDKQGASMELSNLNNPDRAEWQLLDRCYLFPVMLDQGVENYNHKILDYMDSYMSALSADKCLSAAATDDTRIVTGVEFSAPYTLAFPEVDGASVFWVVDAVVTVEEYR